MTEPIEQRHIRVSGVDLACYRTGAGENTILLLHGAGVDSALLSWAEVMPLLAAGGYRVIAPDLPGYGASGRIAGDYSLGFYTDIVQGLAATLGGKPLILAGLSLGGGIAINLALKQPELVKILVPVDAWGLFAKLPWHGLLYWFTRSRFNDRLYAWSNQYPAIIKWSLKANLFGDPAKISATLLADVQKAMLEPGAGQPFISFQRSEILPKGFAIDLFSRLAALQPPTLLIHGSKDKAVPLKGALLAAQKIPDCELYIMEGCKHWPQKERPEEFSRALLAYLARKLP